MKKLFNIIICIMLISSTLIRISSETHNLKSISDFILENFLNQVDKNIEIVNITPLYDGKNEINGYWYHLGNNEGYVIVYNWKGILKVTEFSFDRDLDLDTKERVYYDGLASYYQVENNSLVNLYTKRQLINSLHKTTQVNYKETINSITMNNNRFLSYSFNEKLDHSIQKINQNDVLNTGYDPGTLCTQTSSAMLIKYYDNYHSGFSSLCEKSGVSLVKEVLEYMKPDNASGSTSLNSLKNGLTNFISSKGFDSNVSYHISDEYGNVIPNNYPNVIYQDIKNEKPGIVLVGKNSVDENNNHYISGDTTLHAMTIYGITTINNDLYLSVVDPYGAIDRNILWDTYSYPGDASAIYAVVNIDVYK